MCSSSNGNATGADDDPVPAAALAAALTMIAVGIAIVAAYGCGQKRAWRPEQTYVLPSADQPGGFPGTGFDTIPLEPEPDADDMDESGVEGLDNGLSDTLQTSLIQERQC